MVIGSNIATYLTEFAILCIKTVLIGNTIIHSILMPFKKTFNRFTAHLILLKHLCGCCLFFFLILGLPFQCLAQEIEPRRWNHLPIGSNFVGGGYAYTEADISFDPVSRIKDAQMELHTWAVKYIHAFELFKKSARIDLSQGYQEGRWTGSVNGVRESIQRKGMSDSLMRLAVNLYGAPPLKGEAFASYRASADVETIVGTAVGVQLPTGEYMDDKLINLGTNRFTFRPQFGVLHRQGKWSIELTGEVWLFTDNDDFFSGNKLEQDPLYTFQTHIIYNFRPGLWAAAGVGYFYGGETALNGDEQNDTRKILAWSCSLGFPITPWLGIKVFYLGNRNQAPTGQDADSVGGAITVLW